jgi:putative Mg2+ transporter-C (MgtC) family protein
MPRTTSRFPSVRPALRHRDKRLLETLFGEEQEGVVRTILLRHVNSSPRMTIQRISTQEAERDGHATVVADIFSVERNDRAMQDSMSRINIDPSVSSASWEKVENEPSHS